MRRSWCASVVGWAVCWALSSSCAGVRPEVATKPSAAPPTRFESAVVEAPRVVAAAEVAPALEVRLAEPGSGTADTSAPSAVPREQTRVIVLMYHSIDYGPTERSVTPERFAEHLSWLRAHDVAIVPLSALVRFLAHDGELPARAAVITIDDGELTAYTNAFPVLKRENAPFALGLPTQKIGHPSTSQDLEWDAVREMVASGLCEIASHGHTHENLATLSIRRKHEEIERSASIISDALGVRPRAIFYPFGHHDENTRALARRAGFEAGFAALGGVVDSHTDAMRVPRYQVSHGARGEDLALFFSRSFPQPE